MAHKNWEQVKDTFHEALRRDSGERDRFLDETCGGDIDFRIEVESLLISLAEAKNFLEQPVIGEVSRPKTGWQLENGQAISHYRIVSPIASGGMGEVYLAEDEQLRRNVALKVLPEDLLENRERLRRFQREAHVVSALNHPNILTIFEFGTVDDIHFLASEFVKGETLRARLENGRLTLHDTLEIATQIASALKAAHEAGIVHRDIKPENVMIRDDGYVKILDFGLAKLAAGRTSDFDADTKRILSKPGVIMGTVTYMSPEQARARPIDARTDLFSFGVILYEMLAGRVPFAGETTTDVIAEIIQATPRPVSSYNAAVPDDMDRIVAKCLEKDRDERYQTAADLFADLKRLLKRSEPAAEAGAKPSKTEEQATKILAPRPTDRSISANKPSRKSVFAFAVIGAVFVAALGIGYWYYNNQNTKQIDSIAVMPFVNESGNTDVEYLSDGLTETLISSLSQLPNLNVKARSSVFRYKGKETSAQSIGKELNVQAILNGTMVQRGTDLTLHVELIDAQAESVLWSADYKQPMANLVSLQSDITRDVSNRLRLKLSGADESRVTKHYTDNPEAYELYLKGRYFAGGKIEEEELKKSIEYYRQAIDRDPNYALAYIGIAHSYMRLGSVYGFLPPRETFPKAKAAVMKAQEIDVMLGEAHTALAAYYLYYEWNSSEAERELKRAIEFNPNDSAAHWDYGSYFQRIGRFDEAIAERKLARELDPLSPIAIANVGYPYYYARQYDQAIEHFRKAVELDPTFSWAHLWIGQAEVQKGMHEEAIAKIKEAIALSDGNVRAVSTLGYAYAMAGRRREAQKVIDQLQEQSERRYVSPYFIAVVYSGLGERDKAFAALENAYQERHPYLTLLKVEPVFDNLHSDPRFQDLLRRVGLPQ